MSVIDEKENAAEKKERKKEEMKGREKKTKSISKHWSIIKCESNEPHEKGKKRRILQKVK